jgi:hypothetical protein
MNCRQCGQAMVHVISHDRRHFYNRYACGLFTLPERGAIRRIQHTNFDDARAWLDTKRIS